MNEISANTATAADLEDMFGMPDPESDGPMCDRSDCVSTTCNHRRGVSLDKN